MADSENGVQQARKQEIAAQAVDPCVTSSAAVAAFWVSEGEAIDLQSAYDAIEAQVREVRRGKLSGVEATMVAQAAALNGIFVDMALRGQANLNRPGSAADRYLRMALKAQNQCRATLEALACIATRPSKALEEHVAITRIERVIIRPPIRLEGVAGEGEIENKCDSELDD